MRAVVEFWLKSLIGNFTLGGLHSAMAVSYSVSYCQLLSQSVSDKGTYRAVRWQLKIEDEEDKDEEDEDKEREEEKEKPVTSGDNDLHDIPDNLLTKLLAIEMETLDTEKGRINQETQPGTEGKMFIMR